MLLLSQKRVSLANLCPPSALAVLPLRRVSGHQQDTISPEMLSVSGTLWGSQGCIYSPKQASPGCGITLSLEGLPHPAGPSGPTGGTVLFYPPRRACLDLHRQPLHGPESSEAPTPVRGNST